MDNSPQNNVSASPTEQTRSGAYNSPSQAHPFPTQIAGGVQIPAPRAALPSAAELAEFGKIDASFPERLLAMTEANAATERATKIQAQKFQWRESVLSRLLGFAFSAGALATILLLTRWGAYPVAVAVAAAIAATTYAIVWRERDKK